MGDLLLPELDIIDFRGAIDARSSLNRTCSCCFPSRASDSDADQRVTLSVRVGSR